ncbi:MAG TPA: hypothetical protein DCR78_20225 [Pseudomonas sp.]|nr:hypothetical protein [Pseudomonas sp.]HAW22278.1 hypothetical protein [Pseudomonas sp.]|tara:strand:+ start:1077 stop:1388 length:312 start_codon:yes stop_codon:yes gene_type:complete
MLKKLAVIAVLSGLVANANAWEDVNYTRMLPSGAVYCTSQGKLEEFGGYAQDGDERGADRMIESGSCRISSGMKVQVFQEDNGFLVTFLSPSGKAFYTFKAFL